MSRLPKASSRDKRLEAEKAARDAARAAAEKRAAQAAPAQRDTEVSRWEMRGLRQIAEGPADNRKPAMPVCDPKRRVILTRRYREWRLRLKGIKP